MTKQNDKISNGVKNNFNIIISGVGGQGAITLTTIIAEAAFIEGKDIKTSELHGLSQKGGSVQTHIRFGKKVNSPLVKEGAADLILALEISEALRNVQYANSKTVYLINGYSLPYENCFPNQKIEQIINKEIKGKKYIVPASRICQEKLGKEVVSGIYLLSYAVNKGLIPLKTESILKAIENLVPKKYLALNKKAFNLDIH